MQAQFAFLPRASNQNPPAGSVQGAVTAAVTQINLPAPAPYETETTALFSNIGSQWVYWCFGAQAGLTTANGVPVGPGTQQTFTIPAGVSQISVIAGATGSTLAVTVGDGV